MSDKSNVNKIIPIGVLIGALILLFAVSCSCQNSNIETQPMYSITLENTDKPKTFEYVLSVEVDSMDYLEDFIQHDSLLFLVGGTFTKEVTKYSKVACINLNTETILWSIKLDKYQNVNFQKFAIINDTVILTGVVGNKHILVKERWRAPSILLIDFHGNITQEVKLGNDNDARFTSNMVFFKENYYMIYDSPKVDGKDTYLLRLSDSFEILKMSYIEANELYHKQILLIDDKLYLLGSSTNELFLFYLDVENLKVNKVPVSLPTPLWKYNYFIKEKALNIIAIRNNEDKKINKIISTLTLQDDEIYTTQEFQLTDSTAYFYSISNFNRTESQTFIQTKNSYEHVSLNGNQISRIEDFGRYGTANIKAFTKIDNFKIFYLVDKGKSILLKKRELQLPR